MTDYVTLRNDGDTKTKVNNIAKENYKQLQLIASRREQKKKTKKTLSSRSFALTHRPRKADGHSSLAFLKTTKRN